MKILKNKKGQATIEFLIVALLIFMVIFGSIDYWLAIMKIQQGEHVKNYYLDRARIAGWLSPEDKDRLMQDMNKVGFSVTNIESPGEPLLRTLHGQPPEVNLTIKTQFTERPFMLSSFLGKNEENTAITFSGVALSERIDVD